MIIVKIFRIDDIFFHSLNTKTWAFPFATLRVGPRGNHEVVSPPSFLVFIVILHPLHRFFSRRQLVFELQIVRLTQYLPEQWSRLVAEFNQVFPGNQRRRLDFLNRQLGALLLDKGVIRQVAVARQAVHAVDFQFVVDGGARQEPLERGQPHLGHVDEIHVVVDHLAHAFQKGIRRLEPAQQERRHGRTHAVVVRKPYAVTHRHSGGFSYVVQERAPGRDLRRVCKQGQRAHRVRKYVALGVKFPGLLHSPKTFNLRQNNGKQPALVEEHQRPVGMRTAKDFVKLRKHALGGYPRYARGIVRKRRPRMVLYGKAEPRG